MRIGKWHRMRAASVAVVVIVSQAVASEAKQAESSGSQTVKSSTIADNSSSKQVTIEPDVPMTTVSGVYLRAFQVAWAQYVRRWTPRAKKTLQMSDFEAKFATFPAGPGRKYEVIYVSIGPRFKVMTNKDGSKNLSGMV